jgi:deazaflavin-dependent oxidoreductase (nitroreductase family)
MLRISSIPTALLRAGIPLGPLYLLNTTGRRTGMLRTVPVVVFDHNNRRWLVSMYGDVGWVSNLRAAGTGSIRRGRCAETIHCREITDQRRPEIAMHLRRRFGIVPFVRAAFDATAHDGIGAFATEAHRHPVFLIEE